jgi:SAM-dependent methyltransferase
MRTQLYERRLGIATQGLIEARDLGSESPDSIGYSPLEYQHIFGALRAIPFPAHEVVFLDYGAGKGRVLAAAAARPFRKVIGVEISGRLVAAARENVARLKGRRAGQVEVLHCDAADYVVQGDVNVIFLFNPFTGRTLTNVVYRIECSWQAHPRELFVIAFNHAEFDRCVQGQAWLIKVRESALCGMYRAAVTKVSRDSTLPPALGGT